MKITLKVFLLCIEHAKHITRCVLESKCSMSDIEHVEEVVHGTVLVILFNDGLMPINVILPKNPQGLPEGWEPR